MIPNSRNPSREDVLNAFSLEEQAGKETLSRYIRSFPQYAEDLVDLSLEMAQEPVDDSTPLSKREQELIEDAWQRYLGADPSAMADVLSTMSVGSQKEVSKALGVPRQVITALRERRAIVETITEGFRTKLAAAMNVTVEHITANLMGPCQPTARAYKSDQKPTAGGQVSLEQILIEAGVSSEHRHALLEDEI